MEPLQTKGIDYTYLVNAKKEGLIFFFWKIALPSTNQNRIATVAAISRRLPEEHKNKSLNLLKFRNVVQSHIEVIKAKRQQFTKAFM